MSKLIRLLGKAGDDGTTKEIKNYFKEPIPLTERSKISFMGAQVDIVDDVFDERFIITTDNNTFTVSCKKNSDVTVTLTPGTYEYADLLTEIQKQIIYQCGFNTNSTPPQLAKYGYDFRVIKTNTGKFELSKSESVVSTNKFLTQWYISEGAPTLTENSFTAVAGAIDQIVCKYPVPNASFNCRFGNLLNTDRLRVVIAGGTNNGYFVGLQVNAAGDYEYAINGTTWVATGVAAAPADTWSFNRNQDTVSISYARAGVITVLASDTISASVSYDYQGAVMQISSVDAASTNGFTAGSSTLYVPPAPSLLELTVSTDMIVTWGSEALARYLGFKKTGPFTVTGNPSVLFGDGVMEGKLDTQGILVVLEDFILDSWDGAETAKGRSSILYVLNSDAVNNKTITFNAPELVPLSLRAISQHIQSLRVSFRGASNGDKLTLSGAPMVYLTITN